MSGEVEILAAPTGGSASQCEAESLGLDARAVRYDCLKLAAEHERGAAAIALAERMARFVLDGQVG